MDQRRDNDNKEVDYEDVGDNFEEMFQFKYSQIFLL